MQNSKEIQIFTSFDTLSVYALITVCTALIITIVSSALSDQYKIRAQVEAERVAIQLIASGDSLFLNEDEAAGKNRNLASLKLDGETGKDPWNHSFKYFLNKDRLGKIRVVVISAGPNGPFETEGDEVQTEMQNSGKVQHFRHDDIGTVQKSWL